MKFDLEHLIFALSDSIDLVGVDEILHGKRVACMAWNCAETMGLSEIRKKELFQLGLLHDCGVSSTEERSHLMQELEWKNSSIHCQIGANRMESFSPLSNFALPILHHHTRWERIGDSGLPENIRTDANLIYMLDRIDYLCQVSPGSSWLDKKDSVRHRTNGLKGTYFSPELVEAFLDTSANEAFWFSFEPMVLMDFMEQQKKSSKAIHITMDELKKVATLFAEIVDAKSRYTAEHSMGVASLANLLAQLSGLDEKSCFMVEVAGLLHDLGKLKVPDRILNSPGPLLGEDLSYMRHHSYVTHRILSSISGLEDIATWAGNHHEALDGSGYPFRRCAEELSIESRIIAVADMFQALAQARPYRQARPLESILDFLKSNSDRGRIDKDVVALVMNNSKLCYEQAVSQ